MKLSKSQLVGVGSQKHKKFECVWTEVQTCLKEFPGKPPRMHRRTYERLHHAYQKARDRCVQGMLGRDRG